jgi:hypothetical protein
MARLVQMAKRYYQGAASIDTLAVATLDEAIEKARKTLERDPRRESVNIVKVVAVVKRAQLPVVVETVVNFKPTDDNGGGFGD